MNSGWKAKKPKETPAEIRFKKKHDTTKAMIDQMNLRNFSNDDGDSRHSASLHNAKVARMLGDFEKIGSQTDDGSTSNLFSSNALGGGNIHNNINVAINYTVHQGSKNIQAAAPGQVTRKRKGKKVSRRSHEHGKESAEQLIDSDFTAMLDRQLLMNNSQVINNEQVSSVGGSTKSVIQKRRSERTANSLTNDIWHGDKIYMNNGAMAFKPLGMETVIEQDGEARNVHQEKSLPNKLTKTTVTLSNKINKSNRKFMKQTTEQNLAMQQRLNQATAEELISFPEKRYQTINLESASLQDYKTSDAPMQQMNGKRGITSSFSTSKMMPHSRSAAKELLYKSKDSMHGDSKSSLKTISVVSPSKRVVPVENRMVHPALQIYQQRTSAIQTSLVTFNNDIANFSAAVGDYHRVQTTSGQQSVQFDESAINAKNLNNGSETLTKGSMASLFTGVTGGEASQPVSRLAQPPQKPLVAVKQLIGNKLHRQNTGNTKTKSRMLRDMRYDNEDQTALEELVEEDGLMMDNPASPKLKVDTVFRQAMPVNELKQRGTITTMQKLPKMELVDQQAASNTNAMKHKELQDEKVSKLAIDYSLHQANKQRIQSLMKLLQPGSGRRFHSTIDASHQNDVESARDDDILSDRGVSKKSSLPIIANRNHGSLNDQLASTDDGNSAILYRSIIEHPGQNTAILQDPSANNMFEQTTSVLSDAKKLNSSIINDNISLKDVNMHASQIVESTQRHRPSRSTLSGTHIDDYAPNQTVERVPRTGNTQGLKSPIGDSQTQDLKGKLKDRTRFLTKSTILTRQQRHPKYKMMRSSMFSKNPVIDRIVGAPMKRDQDDTLSSGQEYSTRFKSSHTRRNESGFFAVDQAYATIGGTEDYHGGVSSIGTHQNARSMSSHKLKPITLVKRGDTMRSSKQGTDNAARTQSLHFKGGLTYVMIKGKVQPSEKYIYKNMLPYTTPSAHQTTQIKSPMNRRTLILQQMPNQQLSQTQKQAMQQSSGTGKPRGKKLKGLKMKRSHYARTEATGSLQDAVTAQRRVKKNVIMEAEEEGSGSDDITMYRDNDDRFGTWQEYMDENQQLKKQIQNQIAIFEQYLKVAILQHKAQKQQEMEFVGRQSFYERTKSVDDHFFKESNFEFEEDQATKLYASAQRRGKSHAKRPNATVMNNVRSANQSANALKRRPLNRRSREGSVDTNSNEGRQSQQRMSKSRKSCRSSRINSATQSPVRSRYHRSIAIQSKQSNADSKESSSLPQSLKKTAYLSMSRKISTMKMKALEHLQISNKLLNGKDVHVNAHAKHQYWLRKIERVWLKLNAYRNTEIVRVQDEIQRNKEEIQRLTRDNLFELDVNMHDQRVLLKANFRKRKVTKRLQEIPQVKMVQQLEKKIREQLARKMEFDTWGLHNHIIEYRLKVRMTEDVIDCAQRLTVKADAKTERELNLLKMLRDRTYEDLRYFVTQRDSKPWRNWDRRGTYYKPMLENKEQTLMQVTERVEAHLMMISYLEPRHDKLLLEIPPYNLINSSMIQFCTDVFGNEGWLQLFQLKQLRRQQEREQNDKQYMPPVDHIKRFQVNPHTMQIDTDQLPDEQSQEEISQNLSSEQDVDKALDTTQPVKSKPSAWDLRKPDSHTQATLKTGYEKIIEQRRQSQDCRQASDQDNGAMLVQELSSTESVGRLQTASAAQTSRRTSQRQAELPIEIINMQRSTTALSPGGSAEDDSNSRNYILVQKNATPLKFGDSNEMSVVGAVQFNQEGDVIEQLKKKADEFDKEREVQEYAQELKRSTWLQALERERQERAEREAAERKARAARLAILFEEAGMGDDLDDAGDDEDLLDLGAVDTGVKSYMDKIETHLQVEKRLLEAWHEKDVKTRATEEGDGQEPTNPSKK